MDSTDSYSTDIEQFRSHRVYGGYVGELKLKHIIQQADNMLEILCRMSVCYPTDGALSNCIHSFTSSLSNIDRSITKEIPKTHFNTIAILYESNHTRMEWLNKVVMNDVPFYQRIYRSHPNNHDLEDAKNLSAIVLDMLSYFKITKSESDDSKQKS